MTSKDVRTDVDLKGTGQDRDPDHLVRIHIIIKDVTIVAKLDISDAIVEKGGGGPDKDQSLTTLYLREKYTVPILESRNPSLQKDCQ